MRLNLVLILGVLASAMYLVHVQYESRRLTTELDLVQVHGHPERRLAGNLNVSFACVESGALITALDGIAVSTGSACSTAMP